MTKSLFTLSALTIVLGACAVQEQAAADEAPAADDSVLEEAATITSTNATGTWVADARPPGWYEDPNAIHGQAIFTGPAGATRRMGVCLLEKSGGACSTAADCAGDDIVPGGFRYCTAAEGTTAKSCYLRQGPPSTHCAGTPATGGPVAPGLYRTPTSVVQFGRFISYACFEGCTATDPSASSTTYLPTR